jgi:hypothetical protein
MRRREFIALLGDAVIARPLVIHAEPEKVYRVGVSSGPNMMDGRKIMLEQARVPRRKHFVFFLRRRPVARRLRQQPRQCS